MSDHHYGSAPVDWEDVEGATDIEASDAPIELDADVPAQRPVLSSEPASDLATLLREEFGARTVHVVEVIIPGSEDWSLAFRTDWSETASKRWAAKAKQAVTKSDPSGINFTRLWTLMVIDQCVDVRLRGKSVLQPGPYRKVLASSDLLEAIDETRPEGAVKFFLPVYAQLQSVATTMQRLAGEGEGVDPSLPEQDVYETGIVS
jgi:hypothetical protein